MTKDNEQNIGRVDAETRGDAALKDGLIKLGVPEDVLEEAIQAVKEGRAVAIHGISPNGTSAEEVETGIGRVKRS